MSARDELQQLKSEIEDTLSGELFFFPQRWEVEGYWGAGDVMFVAQKPSTGTFPTRYDRLFYGSLVVYGFEDAHITDISKECGKGGQKIGQDEFERNLPYLRREVEIVEPKVMVALGERAETWLRETDFEMDPELMRVNHYTWGRRYGNEDVFLSHVKEVYQRVNELSG